jgi:peptidoglycan/LPS O-acetylase OafA/YrhL
MQCQSSPHPKLHSINAIRVIAEFAVVRLHVIENRYLDRLANNESHMLGPYGLDIMSFFFVLSGFVMMYTYHDTDFSCWAVKVTFIRRRLLMAYPAFLFMWLCAFPGLIFEWSMGLRDCWARKLCTFMQLGMLDSWLGCGCSQPVLGVTWFLSCLMWFWIAFPF